MKKGAKRKILFFSLGIIVLLGITAFILAKTGVFVKQFKNIIEIELTKALNREVTIEKIEGGVFDSIELINVRIAAKKEIKDGNLIVIEKVSVKYSFKDIILNKKQIIDSLKGVELIRPSLLMEKDDQGAWNLEDFINSLPVTEKTLLPEKLTISVSKGLVGIKDGKKKFNSAFRDIYGNIEFIGAGKISFKAASKSYSSKKTNLFVDGIFDAKNKTSTVIIDGKDLDLAHYSSYAFAHMQKPPAEIMAGTFDFQVKLSDNVTAEVLLKNGEAKIEGLKAGLTGIISQLTFTKESVVINKFAATLKNASITGKGEINNYLAGDPEGKLKIYINGADLSDFSQEEFMAGVFPAGICSAGMTVEGKFSSPVFSVVANARNLRLAGIKTDNNEMVLKYKNDRIDIESLKIYSFDGIAKLSGKYDLKKDALSLSGEAAEMQAKGIFDLAGVPGATGKAAFTFEVKGPLKNLIIASKVRVNKMTLQSGNLGEITSDLLFFDNGKLRVNAVSSEKITMNALFTFQNGRTFTDGTIKFAGANFSNAYGFFVNNKMDLAGETFATFSMKGPLEDITLFGDISINNYNFEGYRAKNVKGNLTINRGSLVGTGLYFNQDDKGYMKADGSMGLTGDLALNLAVTATNIDFSKIPVFNAHYKISGRGTVSAKILGSIAYPKFITTLTSENLILDGNQSFMTDLSFTYDNAILKVERLNLDDEYFFNGEIAFLNELHIDSSLAVKNGKLATIFTIFKWPHKENEVKGTLSGNIRLSGDFDSLNGEGSLRTKEAEFFGNIINTLGLNFSVKDGLLAVKNLELKFKEVALSAEGAISLKEKGRSGLVLKMENVRDKTFIRGRYNLSATGLFDSDKNIINAKLLSSELFLGGEPVHNIEADLAYNKSENKFTLGEIKWEKCSGKLDFFPKDNSLSANLKFSGTDINKLSLLNSDLKKFLINGTLSGDLAFKLDKDGWLKGDNKLTVTGPAFNDFKGNRITADLSFEQNKNGYEVQVKRLLLSQEVGAVDINGTISSLDKNLSLENAYCNLVVSVLNPDIKNLLPLIKSKADISARLSAPMGIAVKGKLSSPRITGVFKAADVRTEKMLLGDFTGEFIYDNNVLDFKSLSFDDATTDNHASFYKANFIFKKDQIQAQLSAAVDFKKLLGLSIKAEAETKNCIIPLTDNGKFESELFLKNFKLNDYEMRDFSSLFIATKQGLLIRHSSDSRQFISKAKGEIVFKNPQTTVFKGLEISINDNTPGIVKINGALGKASDMVVDITNTNIKVLLKYLNLDLNMTGTVNHATALYSGDAAAPRIKVEQGSLIGVNMFDMSFSSVIGDLYFENNKLTLANINGVEKEYKGNSAKELYSVNVNGSIPMDQENEQNLIIKLKNTDLKPIMITGWFSKVEGLMDAEFVIKGKSSYPVIDKGFLIIHDNAAVYPLGFIAKVDKLRAKFSIDNNNVKIAYFSGEVDKSPLEVSGEFTLKKFYPDVLRNIKIRNKQTVERKGLKFKVESIMSTEGTMFVKGNGTDEFFSIGGTAPNFKMNGEIHIYDTRFSWPPNYKEGESAPRVLKEMDWNLKVVIEEGVLYNNSYCEAKLRQGSVFTSQGPGQDLTMRGKADIESGYFNFYTGKFDIKTASFSFLETEKRQPAIKAYCEYSTSTHKIYMEVRGKNGAMAELGNGENFDMVFTSQPEETRNDILRILSGIGDSSGNIDPTKEFQRVLSLAVVQTLKEITRDILGPHVSVIIEEDRTKSVTTSRGEFTVGSDKYQDILSKMKIGFAASVTKGVLFKATMFRQDIFELSSQNPGLWLPDVGLEINASGNRKINVGWNPNEVKVGIFTTIAFDNEAAYKKGKTK